MDSKGIVKNTIKQSELNKLPPQSLDAEKAVLGSMLLDFSAVSTAVDMLKESHFYSTKHQKIFSVILKLYDEGKPIDTLLVIEELNRKKLLEQVEGQTYITSLLQNVSTAAHIEHYSYIVKEKAVLRSLITSSTRIISDCYKSEDLPDTILDRAEQDIFDIAQDRAKAGFEPVSANIHDTIENMESLFKNQKSVVGVSIGFSDLDKITSGFHPANLIIIAGRPSMGKTSLCLNIAQHISIREKLPVGIFSLEMSREELIFRMICSESRVNAHHARTGFLPKKTWPVITRAAEKLSDAPIYVDDSPALSVLEMKSRARRLKLEKGLSLVIVDYLQLMAGKSGKAEYRQQDVSEITRGLKVLAKDLKVPVIALSQLSRATEMRKDQRPMLSDLRESGAIEQDADVVVFIYREGYYKPDRPELENKAEIIIGKQRNGPTGVVPLIFKRECTRFENISNIV
ncbi:replicative DNA helicase [bacterium]